jgi:hypothetical protein
MRATMRYRADDARAQNVPALDLEGVPAPVIKNPTDAIVRVPRAAHRNLRQ